MFLFLLGRALQFILKILLMLTRYYRWILLCLMGIFSLSACSSIDYKEGEYPRMLVTEDDTPLFHNGPAQGSGPDRNLSKGDEVSVLRKEFGYSVVKTSDGGKGYVDNEALVKAPSKPTSTPQPEGQHEATETIDLPSQTPGFRY
jgi:uncharacterized protein YgiM (DUF1202 family)